MKLRAVVLFCSVFLWLSVRSETGSKDLPLAREALDRDDYKLAVDIAEKACAEDPRNPEAWIILGHALSGQIDQASIFKKASLAKRTLAAYSQAVVLAPQNVEAHNSLLQYYLQAPSIVGGDRAKAIKEAEIILPLEPALAHAWLIRFALEDHRLDDAERSSNALLKLEPDGYRALYWFGAASEASGHDLPAGLDSLRRALTAKRTDDDPPLDEAQLKIGHISERLGDSQSAIKAYRTAIAINPKVGDAAQRLVRLQGETK